MKNSLASVVENPEKDVKSYFIDRQMRLRSPGDDDGGSFPAVDISLLYDDPFQVAEITGDLDLEALENPYLDSYACTGGVGEFTVDEPSKIETEYKAEINRSRACGFSAVVLSTADFDDYLHALDCRKHWCPQCGGKNGKIHRSRKKAIRNRIDLDQRNLRYLVLTVPEEYRCKFKSRKGLNQLFRAARILVKRFFSSQRGACATIHLYGDSDIGKFNPHINILIPEDKSVKLLIDPDMLERIKLSWMRSLIGMGCLCCDVVDVYYSFRTRLEHKGHCIKYVVRPAWTAATLEKVEEPEKWFLVLDLKGFHYIRFWGELANCKYAEGRVMTIKEAKADAEAVVGKPMYFRGIVNANIPLMLREGRLIKVGEGLYKIVKQTKGGTNERNHIEN